MRIRVNGIKNAKGRWTPAESTALTSAPSFTSRLTMSVFSIKQAACSAVEPYLQRRVTCLHQRAKPASHLFGADRSLPLAFAAARNLTEGCRPAA